MNTEFDNTKGRKDGGRTESEEQDNKLCFGGDEKMLEAITYVFIFKS